MCPRRPRRVEGLSACGRAWRVRRARHRPRERKEPHRGRRDSGNRSRIARGRQLPDHRTGDLGTVAAAVHLPDDRVRACPMDRSSVRRSMRTARRGPSSSTSIDRRRIRRRFKPLPAGGALPPDVAKTTTSEGRTVNFIVRVETGTMNRGIYQNAVLHDPTSEPAPTPVLAAERMEPPAHRAARFGLSLGLVHPGRTFRRQHSRQPAAGAGLRAVHQHAQSPDQQLQRVRRRRNDDDGQGTVHRDVRRAVLHDQHGRFGRGVHEPASRRRLPGPDRRRQHPGDLPGCAVDRAGRARRPSADALLHRDESGGLHRDAAGRGERIRGAEGIPRCRESGAADRPGARSRRPRPATSRRAGMRRCRRRSGITRRAIRRARGRRSSTPRRTSTASIRRPVSRCGRSTTSACSTASSALNVGNDHRRAVPRSQRADRRRGSRLQLRREEDGRRRERDQARLPGRLDARRQRRAGRRFRSSTTRRRPKTAATTTAGSTSRCASGCARRTAAPTTW